MVREFLESDVFDGLPDAFVFFPHREILPDHQRDLDVFADIEDRDQIERLEDETDLAVAQLAFRVLVERADLDAVDLDLAGILFVQTADQVEERGFARPRRADESRELASVKIEIESPQRVHGRRTESIAFVDPGDFDERGLCLCHGNQMITSPPGHVTAKAS